MEVTPIPEVLSPGEPQVLPALSRRRRRERSAGELLLAFVAGVFGWGWRFLVGVLFCLNYFTSVLVMGWTYRWMQGLVLRGWWKQSPARRDGSFEEFCAGLGHNAPVTRPRWFLQEHIAVKFRRPAPDGGKPSELRLILRAFKVPLGSLWQNLKIGFQALFCTYLLTGWGCLVMLFSWEFGWLNSFTKGYEQAPIGPLTGFLGIFLFILAMFYVPMAQVHQAVTGDFRSFFDFRFIWRLIQARLTAYVALAGLIALLSLPLEILKTMPVFFMQINPALETASDAELLQILNAYLFWCSVVFFPMLLLCRLVAAQVYRSAVLKVLRRGWVARDELHPKLVGWFDRLGIDMVPTLDRAGMEYVVRWSGRWLYRRLLYTLLFLIWFAFVAKVYVGEFFNYHPFMGFMNHALVQFPCFDFVPQALRDAAKGA